MDFDAKLGGITVQSWAELFSRPMNIQRFFDRRKIGRSTNLTLISSFHSFFIFQKLARLLFSGVCCFIAPVINANEEFYF